MNPPPAGGTLNDNLDVKRRRSGSWEKAASSSSSTPTGLLLVIFNNPRAHTFTMVHVRALNSAECGGSLRTMHRWLTNQIRPEVAHGCRRNIGSHRCPNCQRRYLSSPFSYFRRWGPIPSLSSDLSLPFHAGLFSLAPFKLGSRKS